MTKYMMHKYKGLNIKIQENKENLTNSWLLSEGFNKKKNNFSMEFSITRGEKIP